MIFWILCTVSGIEWYFKLPLRLPLSPAEIALILNGNQWYTCDVFTGMFAMLSYTVVTLDVGHCI